MNDKICPLLCTQGDVPCCEESCAWYDVTTGSCAILLLARKVNEIAKEVKRK